MAKPEAAACEPHVQLCCLLADFSSACEVMSTCDSLLHDAITAFSVRLLLSGQLPLSVLEAWSAVCCDCRCCTGRPSKAAMLLGEVQEAYGSSAGQAGFGGYLSKAAVRTEGNSRSLLSC